MKKIIKVLIIFSILFSQNHIFAKSFYDESVPLSEVKKHAYDSLMLRKRISDGDDRHWGGDIPASFTRKGYKYDLPLLSSPRVVDVNEFDVLGFFEVWDTEFDLHFDKDLYRKIDFEKLYILSKQGDHTSRDFLLGSFSLEIVAHLMNNDVRFNNGYKNPLPKFSEYNHFVVEIVRHVYNNWITSTTYSYFLRRFYIHLYQSNMLGSDTSELLEKFDTNCCDQQHWFEGNTQGLKSISSMDADNGWINPFDWFGFHEQETIDEEIIIQDIVKKIHILHENKDSVLRELKWKESTAAWEAMAGVAVIATAIAGGIIVGGIFVPEIIAGISSLPIGLTTTWSELFGFYVTGQGVTIAMNPGVVIGLVSLCATGVAMVMNECKSQKREKQEEEKHKETKKWQKEVKEGQRQASEERRQIQENQKKHEQKHYKK